MPLNEAGRPARANLTRAQQREAELAIYGYTKDPMSEQLLSESEVSTMRAILARHDSKRKPIREFDLNKPPQEPYTHKEFPKAMHDHENRVVKNALDKKHQGELEAQGFQTEAFPSEPPPDVDLTDEERAEAALIDAKLKKKKKA
jgi:hypothetical protein